MLPKQKINNTREKGSFRHAHWCRKVITFLVLKHFLIKLINVHLLSLHVQNRFSQFYTEKYNIIPNT